MRATLLLVLLLLGTAAIGKPEQAALGAKPSKTTTALKLTQHCVLSGDSDVYLTKSALLLKTGKSELSFVMQAPYKDVTVFSVHTGKIIKLPINFKNPFTSSRALLAGIDLSNVPMDEAGVANICQKNCQTFKSKSAWTNEQIERRRKKECEGGEPVETRAEYLSGDYQPALTRLIAHVYGIPEKALVPISLSFREADGTKIDQKHLQTFKIETVQASDELFRIPDKLKSVKTIFEVIQDESADSAMKLMIQ